ncbi:MAG TPA: phosphoglucosamine mutase [Vicinamibacterales bacterium]|nr:phosphoglucosamine mutase [Vicinamibacterales bacterium]
MSAAPRLFGTDGVRGHAGEPPLDRATVRRLGAALVKALRRPAPRLLIGRDTRESGEWIEREFAYGARGCGAEVVSAGVIPTPGVAYLTRSDDFAAGVVISASHNPYQDNGIKVFSGTGEKFTEALEREVEGIVADPSWEVQQGEAPPVPIAPITDAYLDHLRAIVAREGDAVAGLHIALDCANGATAAIAPRLFESLGCRVTAIGNAPDGRNINAGCGSTHPEALAALVGRGGCALGVAFDGDGDRAIFVDERGRIVDGDAVMLMCARQMQAEGRLKGNVVVATVMSNIGLELALRESGITLVRCQVGDKYVMEEMLKRDASLGGEQSGHIIFSDYLFTGDGLCTALQVLKVMIATGRSLASLASDLTAYPQVLVNVRVGKKADITTIPAIAEVIASVEERLGGNGRLLVRYSGTEPLLRIMLEGRDEREIRGWADEIAGAVRQHLA